MKSTHPLSPLGTARAAFSGQGGTSHEESVILEWLGLVRERLGTLYNFEDEVPFLAWELVRWQGGLAPDERRAMILLVLSALVHVREGSTRIPLLGESGRAFRLALAGSLLSGLADVPGLAPIEPERAVEVAERVIGAGRADVIVGEAGDFKPLVVSGPYLYLQKMLALENRFVASIGLRLDEADSAWTVDEARAALADVRGRPAVRDGRAIAPTEDQEAAIVAATRHRLAVISGGPGTGKTTIVVSILRVLRRLGITPEDIALAAPTGKAANRMGQAIRLGLSGIADPADADRDLLDLPEPKTLHRLLGYSPKGGRFLHHENNRLAERVVVVDEASMIDLALMERLVRSLRDDARFLLLGDSRQLPSVEAGAVLRDLLGDGGERSPLGPRGVRLVHSHRMRREDDDGRNIYTVAQTIDRGAVPEFVPIRPADRDDVVVERPAVSELVFRGVEFVATPEGSGVLDAFLDRWYRDVIRALDDFGELAGHVYATDRGEFDPEDQGRIRRLFEHVERSRILCLTRVLPSGADWINEALHRRVAAGLSLRRDDELAAGEPVMMQVNDYNRMVFNGDQGLVLNVSDGGPPRPMAVFPRPDGYGIFHLDSLRPVLRHSYAMTVHKSQGSEFDRVALVLPDRDLPINTREVLYTALTRSRTSVVLIGDRNLFEQGVAREIRRDSGIAEKLEDRPRIDSPQRHKENKDLFK